MSKYINRINNVIFNYQFDTLKNHLEKNMLIKRLSGWHVDIAVRDYLDYVN